MPERASLDRDFRGLLLLGHGGVALPALVLELDVLNRDPWLAICVELGESLILRDPTAMDEVCDLDGTPLVVRDDRPADLYFQSSVATFQAYNEWGGESLYADRVR